MTGLMFGMFVILFREWAGGVWYLDKRTCSRKREGTNFETTLLILHKSTGEEQVSENTPVGNSTTELRATGLEGGDTSVSILHLTFNTQVKVGNAPIPAKRWTLVPVSGLLLELFTSSLYCGCSKRALVLGSGPLQLWPSLGPVCI